MIKELREIQLELKAPKGQYNSFGKYKYRSCEDILEAVKPVLSKHNCSLTLSDELVFVGDRYYIKATATITNGEETSSVSAFAREPLDKKGMDESQITGTASSYARKYALNGLFLIDDTKDADTDEYANQTKKNEKAPTKKNKTYREEVVELACKLGVEMSDLAKMYGLTRETTEERFAEVLEEMRKADQ